MSAAPSMRGARAASVLACAMLNTAGCATPPEPEKANPSRSTEDCLFSVVVTDWAALDNQRFILYGYTDQEAYLGKLFFPTPDLVNNIGMGVVDEDHNGRICGQSTDSISFRNPTLPGRNPITSLSRISQDEARALIAASQEKRKNGKQPRDQAPPDGVVPLQQAPVPPAQPR
jgi:hypothetical protein